MTVWRAGLIPDFFVTGFGLGIRRMERVLQADRRGIRNRDALRGRSSG